MAKFSFPVNALRSGEFYESDLFVDKDFFLRQGHRVTPALLIRLKKQGIAELHTRLPALAERMHARVEILPEAVRARLAERRDELLAEFGVPKLVPDELYKHAVEVSAASFKDAGDGTLDDFGDLWQTAERIAETVVFTGAEVLKPLDAPNPEVYYSYHTVHVAAMMVGVLPDLCQSVGKIQVAMGCMMHDLGKSHVPREILFKHGSLSPDEYETIKSHIGHSTRILANCGEIHEVVKGMVSGHHEKFNGTGYPDGLAGADIPYFARWLSTCDVYDALTTSRSYQQRIAPPIALELIRQCGGSQFDPDCAKQLTERLGVYPVGSYVLLDGDRLALVTRNFPKDDPALPECGLIDIAGGEPKVGDKVRVMDKSEIIDTFDI